MLEIISHDEPLRHIVPIVDYSIISRDQDVSDNSDMAADNYHDIVCNVDELCEGASEDVNTVTVLLVTRKEPTKIYFKNHVLPCVVKVFDLKQEIANIIVPDNFRKSKQVFVLAYTNVNKDNVVAYVLKLNVSNNTISVRKKEALLESEKKQLLTRFKRAVVETESSFKPWYQLCFVSSDWSQFQGSDNTISTIARVVNTVSLDYASKDNSENNEGLYLLALRKFRPAYRNSQSVGSTGLMEYVDEISDKVRVYTSSQVINGCHFYRGVPAVLINSSRIMFFDRRPTVRTHRYSQDVLVSFSNSDITDFCFNQNKLFVVTDRKQIYVYTNFEAFYSRCYHEAADRQPERSPVVNPISLKDSDLNEDVAKIFAGNLDEAFDFSLPQPDQVIDMPESKSINNLYCFGSGRNEFMAYTTANGGLNHSVNIMNNNRLVYTQDVRDNITKVECAPYRLLDNSNPRSLASRMCSELLLTFETSGGTVIRTVVKLLEPTVVNSSAALRNLSSERFESRSNLTQVSRFLDI